MNIHCVTGSVKSPQDKPWSVWLVSPFFFHNDDRVAVLSCKTDERNHRHAEVRIYNHHEVMNVMIRRGDVHLTGRLRVLGGRVLDGGGGGPSAAGRGGAELRGPRRGTRLAGDLYWTGEVPGALAGGTPGTEAGGAPGTEAGCVRSGPGPRRARELQEPTAGAQEAAAGRYEGHTMTLTLNIKP